MDTALNLPATATPVTTPTPVTDRSVTTKVAPVDASDTAATRPSEKPFVAQVVNARLSGVDFPQNPSEIAPQDRTLRPYDVPMLPYAAEPLAADEPIDPATSALPGSVKTDP